MDRGVSAETSPLGGTLATFAAEETFAKDRVSSLVHPRRIRLQLRTRPVTFRIAAL
jgi:hypothetical protein